MKGGPKSSPCSLGRQVSCQGRDGLGVVAGVVGELDGDRLRGTLGDRSIELGDGSLRLDTLVKPDEANTFRNASRIAILGAT